MVGKVTLDEISQKIGISRTTLYKVINNKGVVSEDTVKKVQEALEKYSYVPNYNARELAKGKKYRIGYIGMRHLSAQYFSILVNQGLERAHNDFVDKGLEILIEESDFDNPEKQLQDIDKMRALGIENFIIAPSDEHLMESKISQLRAEGCNVIFLSRYIDQPGRTYVGVDYYKSGMLAGEMLTKIMPGGGKILIVTNSSPEADTTVKGRYSGFVDWVSRHNGFEVVQTINNVNTEQAAVETLAYLQERYGNLSEIDAIYDITYKLNILAQRLEELGLEKRIKLVGFDVYPENVKYLRNATIDFVVGQQILEQAYDAARMLFEKLCYGTDYQERDYYSQLNVVVSSNVDCFI